MTDAGQRVVLTEHRDRRAGRPGAGRERGLQAERAPLHLDAFAITDMLVALALGLFTTQRIEMYLRAKRMLETARVR